MPCYPEFWTVRKTTLHRNTLAATSSWTIEHAWNFSLFYHQVQYQHSQATLVYRYRALATLLCIHQRVRSLSLFWSHGRCVWCPCLKSMLSSESFYRRLWSRSLPCHCLFSLLTMALLFLSKIFWSMCPCHWQWQVMFLWNWGLCMIVSSDEPEFRMSDSSHR